MNTIIVLEQQFEDNMSRVLTARAYKGGGALSGDITG